VTEVVMLALVVLALGALVVSWSASRLDHLHTRLERMDATVKRGMAEMLKGGVIMDVVTPSRRRSPRTPAPSPSWRSSASRPTSAPRAASRG
jgi:anti-sigma factor RsiW